MWEPRSLYVWVTVTTTWSFFLHSGSSMDTKLRCSPAQMWYSCSGLNFTSFTRNWTLFPTTWWIRYSGWKIWKKELIPFYNAEKDLKTAEILRSVGSAFSFAHPRILRLPYIKCLAFSVCRAILFSINSTNPVQKGGGSDERQHTEKSGSFF